MTMPSDPKQLAADTERVLSRDADRPSRISGTTAINDEPCTTVWLSAWQAARRLAEDYLRTHPADDGELRRDIEILQKGLSRLRGSYHKAIRNQYGTPGELVWVESAERVVRALLAALRGEG